MHGYLKDIFGEDLKIEDYSFPKNTPNYIRIGYKPEKFFWNGLECIILRSLSESWKLSSVKKQYRNFVEKCRTDCALAFDHVTSYQRSSLIRDGIPFVADNQQIFLPFWGMALSENIKKKNELPELMAPGTQLVALFLYYTDDSLKMSEIADRLDISKATCTRAIEDLLARGLITASEKGTSKIIRIAIPKEEYIRSAYYYMQSPVNRIIFTKKLSCDIKMPVCGIKALSQISMISAKNTDSGYALARKDSLKISTGDIISEDEFRDSGGIQIELWNYDPTVLSTDGRVDDISLLLSLENSTDERVQMGLDEIRKRHDLPVPEETE